MIVETTQLMATEIPLYNLVSEYPLNSVRRVLWLMEDMAKSEGRKVIELLAWDKIESLHKVVAIRSEGLENWE